MIIEAFGHLQVILTAIIITTETTSKIIYKKGILCLYYERLNSKKKQIKSFVFD